MLTFLFKFKNSYSYSFNTFTIFVLIFLITDLKSSLKSQTFFRVTFLAHL